MKLGYLLPNGKFYECNYWEHLHLAKIICKKISSSVYNKSIELATELDAENFLMDLGCICFRSRDVNYVQFCSDIYKNNLNVHNYLVNVLTNSQLEYLNNLKDFDNLDQMDCVQKIIDNDTDIRKYIDTDKDLVVNKGFNYLDKITTIKKVEQY